MPVLEPGTQLKRGTFEIVSLLGQGGFGEVYLARQSRVDRDVAIKVLLPHVSANEDMVTRFQREALAAANLLHPNVLTVFDFDFEDPLGVWFLALQYVPGGRTLRSIMTGRIAVAETARYVEAIGSALDAAHSRGITHRDVKPENVLLHGERPLLTDFGIAHLGTMSGMTATGMAIGTPAYMSPEQALGRPIGPGSDQYALAVIAYEMLAGRPPFMGDPVSLMVQHANATPPPLASLNPTVNAAARAAVLLALSKNPDERFSSCTEFARAILAASVSSTASTSPVALPLDLVGPAGEVVTVEPAAPENATPDVPFSYKFPGLTAERPAPDAPLDVEPPSDRNSSETAVQAITPPPSNATALPESVDSAPTSVPVPELEDAAPDAPPEPLAEFPPAAVVGSTGTGAETVSTQTPESLETVLRSPEQPSGSAASTAPPSDGAAPPTQVRSVGTDEPPTDPSANQTPDFMPAVRLAAGAAAVPPPVESRPTELRPGGPSAGAGGASQSSPAVLRPTGAEPDAGSQESSPTVFRPSGPATPTAPLEPPGGTPPPAAREPSVALAPPTSPDPNAARGRSPAQTLPGSPAATRPETARKSGAPIPLLAGIAAAVVLVVGLAIFAVAPRPGPAPDSTPGVAIRPTAPANPTSERTSEPGPTAAPLAPVGSVRVASSPDGAAITLNGEPSGRAPRLLNNLPPGSYTVALSAPSFRDFTQQVEVTENQQVELTAELVPRPPIEVLEIVEERIGKDPYVDPSNLIRLGSFTEAFSVADDVNAIVYLKPSSFNVRGLSFTTTNRWQRAGAQPIELRGEHQIPKEWDQTFLRACAPALALDARGSGAPLGLEILIDGEVAARFSFRIAGGNPASAPPSPCDTSAIPRTVVDRGRLAPPVALAR